MKVILPLMKNKLALLVNTVLAWLELQTAASATDAAIQKRIYGSAMAKLVTPNKSMEWNQISVKVGLLIRVLEKQLNEAKEQKSEPHSMSLGTLAASLLTNKLASKVKITVEELLRRGEVTIRVGQDF